MCSQYQHFPYNSLFSLPYLAVCNSDFRGKKFVLMFPENGGGSTTNAQVTITNPGTFSSFVEFDIFAPFDSTLSEKGKTLATLEVCISNDP